MENEELKLDETLPEIQPTEAPSDNTEIEQANKEAALSDLPTELPSECEIN